MALHELQAYDSPGGEIIILGHQRDIEADGPPCPPVTALKMARQILPHLQGEHSYTAPKLAARACHRAGFYIAALLAEDVSTAAPEPLAFAEIAPGRLGLWLIQLGVTQREGEVSSRRFDGITMLLDHILTRRPATQLCVVQGYKNDTRTGGVLLHELGFSQSPGSPEWGEAGAYLIGSCGALLDAMEPHTTFTTVFPEHETMPPIPAPARRDAAAVAGSPQPEIVA